MPTVHRKSLPLDASPELAAEILCEHGLWSRLREAIDLGLTLENLTSMYWWAQLDAFYERCAQSESD